MASWGSNCSRSVSATLHRLLATEGMRTSFSARSLIRLLSRVGSCITSAFSLRSAASPVTGFAPTLAGGLSLADTHGARPWSGISLVRLPYMAARSWLWRCSFSPLGAARIGSTRSEYSTWFSRPRSGRGLWSATITTGRRRSSEAERTQHELGGGIFVGIPSFGANGNLQTRVQRL